MQHILTPGPLLDNEGNLVEAGYSLTPIKTYSRKAIQAKGSRIKEWDYYYVGNSHYGIALTIADNSYMAMASLSVLDFDGTPNCVTESPIEFFTNGKLNLPSSSLEGDCVYERKGFSFRFLLEGNKRRLVCSMEKVGKKKEFFHCDILLTPTLKDSLTIATPFTKPKHFYYNQKINLLRASGYAKLGDKVYDFNQDSYGVLDWGRGVWTYKNTWYWASCSAITKGHEVGFNLGYGFGDTSAASENILYFDGVSYKLDDVKMDIPMKGSGRDDFASPWIFRSKKGDIALEFKPVYVRHSDTNVLLIRSNQNQVFGLYSGRFEVEGKTIELIDVPGFAEKVYNRW